MTGTTGKSECQRIPESRNDRNDRNNRNDRNDRIRSNRIARTLHLSAILCLQHKYEYTGWRWLGSIKILENYLGKLTCLHQGVYCSKT
jgi:hypothetical protein